MQKGNIDLIWNGQEQQLGPCLNLETRKISNKIKILQTMKKKRQPEGCLFGYVLLKNYFLIIFCTAMLPSLNWMLAIYKDGAALLKSISSLYDLVTIQPFKF